MIKMKMSEYMGVPEADIIKAIKEDVIQPWHDCADSQYTKGLSHQVILSETPYTFHNDTLGYENKNFPDGMTKLWDYTTNRCVFTEASLNQIYVARLQFTFMPSTAVLGWVEVKSFVGVSNQLLQTIRIPFKADESRMEALFAFYLGNTDPYDIKQNGVWFTYESTNSGEVYDRGILIYKT